MFGGDHAFRLFSGLSFGSVMAALSPFCVSSKGRRFPPASLHKGKNRFLRHTLLLPASDGEMHQIVAVLELTAVV